MAPSQTPTQDTPPDLALLLVHGIGQPKVGSVVDPIANALREWLAAHLEASGRTVEIERALLKPAQRADKGPARVTLLVRDKQGQPQHRLRLVESLWADEFDPPGFLGVLCWVLGPGTWLLFRHIVNRPAMLYHALRPAAPTLPDVVQLLCSVFGVLAFFFVVLPVQAVGILLAVLRLVPLRYFQKQIAWLGGVFSEVLGDSYIFACNPVMRRALADHVRRDLDALQDEQIPVAILAHSQGAAVAFDMLEQHPTPPPLITYGAGIRRLHELIGLGDDAPITPMPALFRHSWWLTPICFAAFAGAFIDLRNAFVLQAPSPSQTAGMSWSVVVVLYLLAFVAAGRALYREDEIDVSLGKRLDALLMRQPAWLDLFATHDLVPAGPLLRKQNAASTLDSVEVVNQMRTTADHTSYWASPDGFIDPLMRWLGNTMQQSWWPQPAAANEWWQRRWRTRLRWLLDTVLRCEVVLLWWRASGVATSVLPSAETAGQWVAKQLPALGSVTEAAKPMVESGVAHAYGWFVLLALLVLHFGVLMLAERVLLQPNWQAMDRQLALRGLTRVLPPIWHFIVYLAFFALLACILWSAIKAASYAPLIELPLRLLLGAHSTVTGYQPPG